MADPIPVPNSARPQKDIVLILEGVAYQKQVSNVNFAPQGGGTVSWAGGTPDTNLIDSTPSTGWLASVTCIQAWDDADSLCMFLLEHEGEEADVAYRPHRDSTVTFYSTITLVAPTIGGPVRAFNEATVACPASKPTTTPPTP